MHSNSLNLGSSYDVAERWSFRIPSLKSLDSNLHQGTLEEILCTHQLHMVKMLCFNCNKHLKLSDSVSKFKRPCQLSSKLQNRRFDDSSAKPNSSIMKAIHEIHEGLISTDQLSLYSSQYICHECHSCLRNAVNKKFEVDQTMQQLNERKNTVPDESRAEYYKDAYYLDKPGKCWSCFYEFERGDIQKAHPGRINLAAVLVDGMTVYQSLELLYTEEAQSIACTHMKRVYLCRICLNLLKQIVRTQCQFETYNTLFNSYTNAESVFNRLQHGEEPSIDQSLYRSENENIIDSTTDLDKEVDVDKFSSSNTDNNDPMNCNVTKKRCTVSGSNNESSDRYGLGFEVEHATCKDSECDLQSVLISAEQTGNQSLTKMKDRLDKDTVDLHLHSQDKSADSERNETSEVRLMNVNRMRNESEKGTNKESAISEGVDDNSTKACRGTEDSCDISQRKYPFRKRKHDESVVCGHETNICSAIHHDKDHSCDDSSTKEIDINKEHVINTNSLKFTKTKVKSYPIIKVNFQENSVCTIQQEVFEGSLENIGTENVIDVHMNQQTIQATTEHVSDEFTLYTEADKDLLSGPVQLMLEASGLPYRMVKCEQLLDIDVDRAESSSHFLHHSFPVLRNGGVELSQAAVICRYLGETLRLCPDSEIDHLQAEQISYTCFQCINQVREALDKSASDVSISDTKRNLNIEKFATEQLPEWLKYFEEMLRCKRTQISESLLFGGQPCYADYVLYHTVKTVTELFPDIITTERFPALTAYKIQFENQTV